MPSRIYGKQVLNIGDINIQQIYQSLRKQRLYMKISKYILISFCVVLFGISLTGCRKEKVSEKYISITNTCTVNGSDFAMEVLRYDISDKSVSKIKSIPYSSQYPLTMYDEKTNKVYYTAEAEDGKGDELYVVDCQTNKSEQLTNDFFAINNIYSLEQGIFIAGVKRGEETAVRPFLYNIQTESVKEIPIEDDFFISCTCYNPIQKELYVAGYSETEEAKAFDEQDEDGNMQGICNYIYKYDGKCFQQVYRKDDCYINGIVSVGKDLLIKWGETYFDEHMNISKIQNGIESAFKFADEDISSIAYDGLIYADTKNIFYIRQIEKDDDVVYQLCSYENNTGQIAVLYEAPAESAINNAQVLIK